jgi:transcriptional regulator with XRE-family HTH domain
VTSSGASSRPLLSSAIKSLREKRGLTQKQFAEELGVTLATVGRYETTQKPNRAMLKVFENMCEDYDLPELVPIFSGAAVRPMSEQSHSFNGRARLDAAEKHVVDALEMLTELRNTLANPLGSQPAGGKKAAQMAGLFVKVTTLQSLLKEMLAHNLTNDTVKVKLDELSTLLDSELDTKRGTAKAQDKS